MSQQQTSSLLWINKDASNVHRKKHVAEVNAHVQKSTSKKRTPKKSIGHREPILPARKITVDDRSRRSPGLNSNSSHTDSDIATHEWNSSSDHGSPGSVISGSSVNLNEGMPPAVIFSSYLEDGILRTPDTTPDEDDDADLTHQLMHLPVRLKPVVPSSLDVSNPLPGFLSDLSSHNKMLVHTHLTYMPQMVYGLSNRAAYCPIRNASVANMLRAPVGILWVLISVEMFLETVRKSNARKAVILRRKNQAYQLMSKAFEDSSRSNDETILLGTKAAAIAEMFCGDPTKALTHLNGIDAFMSARGGMEYIQQMDLTITMPIFAISAYRTILQDNLTTFDSFERARVSFMSIMRSLISWNTELQNPATVTSHTTHHNLLQDEGFDGDYDLVEGLAELREARDRAFVKSQLLRRFIGPEYETDKLGEKIDHFIILYNLNRALADHGANLKQAARFVEDLVDDVEASGSTKGVDSSIKISGVLRLITHRVCRMHPHQPSIGVARAWKALDALEMMKLLSPDMQKAVSRTLHLLLLGQLAGIMSEKQLVAIDSAATTEWPIRHATLSSQSG